MKSKNYILIGGGELLTKVAIYLKNALEINPLVLCSDRHFNEIICDITFHNILDTNKIEYIRINKLILDDLQKINIDFKNTIIFSFGAPWIIKQDIIDLFNNNIFNFHGTRLPQNRGGGGATWQIMRSFNYGVTLAHKVDIGIDTGEIVKYEEFIYDNCKKPSDYSKIHIHNYFIFIKKFINDLNNNISLKSYSQSEYFSSYWPRLNTEEHGWIDWSWDGFDIYKFICAFDDPYPGAHTYLNGIKVYLKDAFWDTNDGTFHPFQSGIIYRRRDAYHAIATKGGTLLIKELIDESRKSISYQIGDRLFTPRAQLEEALSQRVVYTPTGLKDG